MEKSVRYTWFARGPLIVSAVFMAIYSTIVFANHYCFRTFAFDLGLYTNALYDYAHLRWNDTSVCNVYPQNLLSDHLDLYLVIFSPLAHIFGQYTLLLVQVVAVVSGALGVYKYLDHKFGNKRLSLLGMLNFYMFFGIFSALSFDYHSNVVAAMQAPWLFYFVEKKKYKHFVALICFMMLAKENISLWCFFISLGLLLEYRKEKPARKWFALCAVLSIVYFVLALQVIMPMFANSGKYEHFKYSVLGTDYNSALKYVFSHPFETLKNLFVNHSGNLSYDWVKTETWVFLLLSGLYCLFFRPFFLVMLIGPICSKMLYDDPTIWSIDCHYSIEFASIITIGAFTFAGKIRNAKWKYYLPFLICLGSTIATIRLMDHTIFLHDYNRLRIYQADHYKRGHDIRSIHKALKMIPDTAVVCVQSPILPHLAYRDRCYQIPQVKDATYIIASKSEPVTYPIDKKELLNLLKDSIQTGRWQPLLNDTNITILKRIGH